MLQRFFIRCIRFYQKYLSRRKRTSTCRFQPCCSQYAITAIERYGAFHGGIMALRRILRCNPFCKGGYDPVPEDKRITLRRE